MSETKPRWNTWQSACLQQAAEAKIPLRIISKAMGRTTMAVSKKMKNLGLRKVQDLPGRIKGQEMKNLSKHKVHSYLKEMSAILQKLAPFQIYEKWKTLMEEDEETFYIPPYSKRTRFHQLRCRGDGLFVWPYHYVLAKDHLPERNRKKVNFGDPFYVSLTYLEAWAHTQGFHDVQGDLKRKGFLYWKEGKLFSKAQLLIYVNRVRYEKKLQPLALFEDEKISGEE